MTYNVSSGTLNPTIPSSLIAHALHIDRQKSDLNSRAYYVQGDHLSGKPGNVGEFDSFRDFTENQGIVREKIL